MVYNLMDFKMKCIDYVPNDGNSFLQSYHTTQQQQAYKAVHADIQKSQRKVYNLVKNINFNTHQLSAALNHHSLHGWKDWFYVQYKLM